MPGEYGDAMSMSSSLPLCRIDFDILGSGNFEIMLPAPYFIGDMVLPADRLGNVSVDVRDGAPVCWRALASFPDVKRMLLNTWMLPDLLATADSSFAFSLSLALFASPISPSNVLESMDVAASTEAFEFMNAMAKSDALPVFDGASSALFDSSAFACSESDGDCEADLVGSKGSYTSGEVGPGGVAAIRAIGIMMNRVATGN